MTQSELASFLVANGWDKDCWGNFVKYTAEGKYRYKMQDISCRHQIKKTNDKVWVTYKTYYYRRLYVRDDGKLGYKQPRGKK